MTQMSMGSNIPIAATALRATLSWAGAPGVPDVDTSALLLENTGEVGSDADFVFYNQPAHYTGAVRLAGKTPPPQAGESIDIQLAALPAEYERVVLAASADGGSFGQVPQLQLTLTDASGGAPIATFAMQAGTETALVTGEFYRRSGAWKFRAVGQGYAAGLAGLAGDFGIDVGEAEPAPAPAPAPAAAAAPDAVPPPVAMSAPPVAEPTPPPPAAPEPPAPVAAPLVAPVVLEPPAAPAPDAPAAANWGTWPQPAAPELPAPANQPPAPSAEAPHPAATVYPPAPSGFAPAAPEGYAPAQAAPPPAYAPPPPPPPAEPAYAPPPPPPAAPAYAPPPPPPPAAPAYAPPPPPAGVSLARNETVDLAHSGPGPLSRVVFSLGWTPAEGHSDVDLDASVIAFDANAEKVAIVWYLHKNEFAGALQHTGDNRQGYQGADGEQILVDLARLPMNVAALVFTINSFRKQTFTDIANAACEVRNVDTGEPLVRFDLSETQPSTALIMASLHRAEQPGTWRIRAIGEFHDCRTVKKLVPAAARQVKLRG